MKMRSATLLLVFIAPICYAGDMVTTSAISIKSDRLNAYLCATTQLKSSDKLYHYTLSLDGKKVHCVSGLITLLSFT